MTALTLNVKPLAVTDEEFYELCRVNPELRIERTARGELVIMPPTGSESGIRSGNVFGQLWAWNRDKRLGQVFDSSTGFRLPNGADRSPDASWIIQSRWDSLTPTQKRGFAPICPDFVVEVCSPTDDVAEVRKKMNEYLLNGARLGWLIDPKTRTVEIYEPEEEVEILYNPTAVSGEPLLRGFILDVREVFF